MKLTYINGVAVYKPVAEYAPELLEAMERRAETTLEQIRQMRSELAQPATPPAPKRMQLRSFRSAKGGKNP